MDWMLRDVLFSLLALIHCVVVGLIYRVSHYVPASVSLRLENKHDLRMILVIDE